MAKLILQNQTEPTSPDAGCTTLFVDSCDWKTKVKDSNGCVCSFVTNNELNTCIASIDNKIKYNINVLAVWAWWWWLVYCSSSSSYWTRWWWYWWWGWDVVEYNNYIITPWSYCVTIWAGWVSSTDYNNLTDWWNTCFWTIVAHWWKKSASSSCWWTSWANYSWNWWTWWWAWWAWDWWLSWIWVGSYINNCAQNCFVYYWWWWTWWWTWTTWVSWCWTTINCWSTNYWWWWLQHSSSSWNIWVVFIAYPISSWLSISWWTIICKNWCKVHTFTSSWTLCVN